MMFGCASRCFMVAAAAAAASTCIATYKESGKERAIYVTRWVVLCAQAQHPRFDQRFNTKFVRILTLHKV